MTRKSMAQEPEKAHRLSLAELAAHDDVCSDALIDNAYYKARIRKNRTKHIPIRGIKEDDVPRILLHKVIVDKDLGAAEKALLALPGLKRYKKSLRSKPEQDHFLSHLRKYIAMYQTDCPWEVSTTNRYTITTYEAAVTARRRIKQGDSVKYLTGTLVPLTTEESADLDLTNRNFSIVVSSRKKNSLIFLGPARFANHDCDANGRLVTRGPDGMEVVAMKNIEVGDEITVSYGDDYFGPSNIDCLCHTCEVLERNGWTSKAAILEPGSHASTPARDLAASLQPRGLKRKRESESSSQSSSAVPSKHLKVTQSPSKLQHSWTPPGTSDSDNTEDTAVGELSEPVKPLSTLVSGEETTLSPPHSPSRLTERGDADDSNLDVPLPPLGVLSHSPIAKQKSPGSSKSRKGLRESKMTARLLGKISSRAPISPAPTSPSSYGSANEAGASTHQIPLSGSAITIKVESMEVTKLEADEDTIVVSSSPQDFARVPEQLLRVDSEVENTEVPPESTHAPIPHAVSTLSTTTISRDVHGSGDSNGVAMEASVLPSIEPTTSSTTVTKLTVHPVTGTIRIAGDYILTRKLLAQPHDRWVQCHNDTCYGFFVQPNGYQTRRECPRCERHSMLYGFPWPKTDPDPRKLLERSGRGKKAAATEYSAYRRKGRCGKGTWVEGAGDPEERVMDHRTIHRFVLPEEERELSRKGLLREAELARAAGDHALAVLEAKMRAGSRGPGTESAAGDVSESGHGSATPDEARRRSNRFVTRPVGVYTDKY
ncbi:histone-lysine N-methyltransferase SUV420H [Capronia epimyces CBS 606.96]|uniref:Histone-lysine N-methyltransferase SET9 n=1 Tax=Capronia epimyces CBS 606.96 TaxID=1182542 RepID=W9YKP7_9EURO|nr:histone-lysine N-methyltransferase SUV420H [Capronia epimyces CBS 606.96]EXJ93138.1 histone-lysine N-methyltransferase SUV420H [Capronia epimyces CBS 606.96]